MYEQTFYPGTDTTQDTLRVIVAGSNSFTVYDAGPGLAAPGSLRGRGRQIMSGSFLVTDFDVLARDAGGEGVVLATLAQAIARVARQWARFGVSQRLRDKAAQANNEGSAYRLLLGDAAGCALEACCEAFAAGLKIRLLGDEAYVVTPLGPARLVVRGEVLGGAESAPAGARSGWLPPVTSPKGRLSLAEAERRAIECLPYAYPEDAYSDAMMPLGVVQIPEGLGVRAGFLFRAVVRAAKEVFA